MDSSFPPAPSAGESPTGNPGNNRRRIDKATSLLLDAAVEALNSNGRVRRITVTVPVHGDRLGEPSQVIERA